MSDESSGGGLKNAIIGLVTIIVTAIAGVIGKQLMGGEEAAPAAVVAPAAAPVINLNVQNTNAANSNAGGGSSQPAPAPKKKDDWKTAEPKW